MCHACIGTEETVFISDQDVLIPCSVCIIIHKEGVFECPVNRDVHILGYNQLLPAYNQLCLSYN